MATPLIISSVVNLYFFAFYAFISNFGTQNSLPATSAYKRARECVNLLQCWKSSYMATRAYIEESGVGSRWEFDKKTLFGLVDHVTRISQDIADIAKVTNHLPLIKFGIIISSFHFTLQCIADFLRV